MGTQQNAAEKVFTSLCRVIYTGGQGSRRSLDQWSYNLQWQVGGKDQASGFRSCVSEGGGEHRPVVIRPAVVEDGVETRPVMLRTVVAGGQGRDQISGAETCRGRG